MSTNPNNAVGTNGAFGGRTSVNAFNDVLGSLNGRGILSGWALSPSSGMVIVAGGDGSTRDVAVAEDNIGNKTTINNISEEPVPIEIPAAPATGSRIDTVVAYVDNPAQGSATVTDNYGACGLIVVSGSAASSPTAPTESDIRTAITADGGAGSVAYYVELGRVTVATGTTDISANMITSGSYTYIKGNNIGDSTITSSKIANNAVTTAKINNAAVTSAKIDFTTLKPRWKTVATSTSQSVTIPAGYRKYRISFGYNKPSNSWGTLVCPQKTASSWIYIQGVNNGGWVQAERECPTSDKAVVDLSRANIGAGFSLYTIDLARNTKTATTFQGNYQATCEGSLTYVSGKIGFTITNGSNSFTLNPYDAGSNYSWVVEAFDE